MGKITLTFIIVLAIACKNSRSDGALQEDSPKTQEELLKCTNCKVGLVRISYLDEANNTISGNAYLVLKKNQQRPLDYQPIIEDGKRIDEYPDTLVCYTVDKFKLVTKDQIISWELIRHIQTNE